MSIKSNVKEFENLARNKKIKVAAVSKTKPNQDILEAYQAGHRVFAENKVQELVEKHESLPKDIEWHMIGHLQRNKVKYIAPFVHLIHSVDSARLLKEVNKQGAKAERIIPCLLQVHIAKEESKFGFSEEELVQLFTSEEIKSYKNVLIKGLMGMATFTEDQNIIRDEFRFLKQLFDKLKSYQADNVRFSELSMGMSGDYLIAIDEGSTIIRVGSAIFGARNYN
ncbi:MAG: YggS family pyridoxal phosphate-dependent enzyme [Cyclobacteriaceae bacterium]